MLRYRYVVCSGIQYGAGEQWLHGLFKSAWLMNTPALEIPSNGLNVVPMIHILDLASVVQNVVEATPESRYILAVDDASSSSAMLDVGSAIARVLGALFFFSCGHVSLSLSLSLSLYFFLFLFCLSFSFFVQMTGQMLRSHVLIMSLLISQLCMHTLPASRDPGNRDITFSSRSCDLLPVCVHIRHWRGCRASTTRNSS